LSALVVDASAVLAWCFEDEAGPEADALIERVAEEGALAPAHWPLELANALVMAERRSRLSQADSAAFLARVTLLPISIEPMNAARAFADVLAIARKERLTSYDAAYLELAMRHGLPLATKDAALRQAADRLGVRGE
jgi:predicted nucleic acid-binding protein